MSASSSTTTTRKSSPNSGYYYNIDNPQQVYVAPENSDVKTKIFYPGVNTGTPPSNTNMGVGSHGTPQEQTPVQEAAPPPIQSASDIAKQRASEVANAKRDYQAALKQKLSFGDRQAAVNQLNQRIAQAQIQERINRVKAGIAPSSTYTYVTSENGQIKQQKLRIDMSNVADIEASLNGSSQQQQSTSVGLTYQTPPSEMHAGATLPFERLTKSIPRFIAKTLAKTQLGDITFKNARQEIPQKRSISSQPTFGTQYIQGQNINFAQATNDIAAIGQFAIPYIGEGLFYGLLLEKPILRPQEFAAQFQAEPVKTAIAYGAGLIGLKGSITSALRTNELRMLRNEIENAKINFVAKADQDTLSILAKTKVRGQNFYAGSKLRTVLRDAGKEAALGTELGISRIDKKIFGITNTRVAGVSEQLPGIAKAVTRNSNEQGYVELLKKIEEAIPFRVRGLSQDMQLARFKNLGKNQQKDLITRLKSHLVEIQKLPPVIRRSDIVGVIRPSQAENIFKINAGNTKIRIYKSGNIKYIFDPRINGVLKIVPSIGDNFSGKTLLSAQIKKAVDLSGLAATQAERILKEKIESTLGRNITSLDNKGIRIQSSTASTGGKLVTTQKKSVITTSPLLVKSKEATQTKQSTNYRSLQESRSRNRNAPSITSTSLFKTEQKTQSKFRQGLRTSSSLKNRQVNQQSLKTPSVPKIRITSYPSIRPPSTPINSIKITNSFSKKPSSGLKSYGVKYDVYTRKGVRLNRTPLSQKAASGLGAKATDVGIKASYFIKQTNRPGYQAAPQLERYFKQIAYKFRPSKKTPGLIVEKNRYRLEKRGRTSEVKQIQSFRRRL